MTDAGAQLHGPGGLLGTPGLGARRKGKWGQRLKDSGYSARAGQTIRGNLARGSDGKFTAAGNASAAKPKRGIVLSKQPKPKITPVKALPKRRSGGKGRAAAKPKAPKATLEQRAAERDQKRAAEQAANRDAVKQAMADQDAGLAPKGFDNLMGLAAGTAPDQAGADGLVKMGMAERGGDGTLRLTESGRAAVAAANRGDAKAAIDAVSRGADQAGKRSAADAKRAEAEAKKLEPKPEKSGGGGSKKPSEDEKRREQAQERAKRADATAAQVGIAPTDLSALRQAAETGGAQSAALAELGLIGPDGQTTDQGRRALSALERGDVRQYNAALQDAKARMGREQGAADRRQQAEARRAAAAQERQAKQKQQIERLKRRALSGGRLSDAQREVLEDAGVMDATGRWTGKAERYGGKKRSTLDDSVFAGPDRSFPIVTAQDVRDAVQSLGRTKHDKDAVRRGIIRRAKAIGAMDALPESWREKSFAVFKDHTGAYRWIARTTTAYRDRDGEIISTKALEADAARMTATKQYGPLRYWHIGEPDPFDPIAPWGEGLDIGDCDYSIVIGRTSIESGTFKSAAIGRAFARSASDYEISPGFFHPLDEPRPDGSFETTRRFERSTVPIKYGRASNLFTGLTVKEHRMDQQTYEARVKAFLADMNGKGVPPEIAAQSLAGMQQADKAAEQQGISFKSEEQPAEAAQQVATETIYYGPGNQPGIIADGQWIALKAADVAPPDLASDAGAAAPVEAAAKDDGMGDMEVMAEEAVEPDAPAGGPYVGDLTPDEFFARLDEHLAPLVKMQEMVKALNDGVSELKSMGGTTTKEAGAVSAELTRLKAQQQQLENQIAQIEGRQPATILPDEVEQAFKSAGPTVPMTPEDAELAETVNDPSRPLAALAARTMPHLYRTNPDGGFAGWTPPPTS